MTGIRKIWEKINQKIADWIYRYTSFPNGCKTGNELDWILKDNCPCCIGNPIECLSNEEYHKKYPAVNRLTIGTVTIYLCDVHLRELMEELAKMSMTEIIEQISDGKIKEFMNPPVEPDGQAYVCRNFKDDKNYIHCPYCGKKQFPVQEDTRIENLLYQCKNSKCKMEFKVELKGRN